MSNGQKVEYRCGVVVPAPGIDLRISSAFVREVKDELKKLESANEQDRAALREMLRLAREVSEGKTYVYKMIEVALEIEKRAQARWGGGA